MGRRKRSLNDCSLRFEYRNNFWKDIAVNTKGLLVPLAVIACIVLSGCRTFDSDEEVFGRYYLTTLKLSKSADILGIIRNDETELLSQSENVIASWGQKKNDSILWFNMIAFDQDDLTAARKYCLAVDEKVKGYYVRPIQKFRFDAQTVLGEDILNALYAGENERRIAVLQNVLENFKSDSKQITFDSSTLNSAALMVNQALHGILYKLDASPALAANLDRYEGLEFDHMTLGIGRIRMLIENDIVKVKIKVGRDWFNQQNFEDHPDVENM